MLCNRSAVHQRTKNLRVNIIRCLLLLLAICSLVTCGDVTGSDNEVKVQPSFLGRNADAVAKAASQSYHQQDIDPNAQPQFELPQPGIKPPLAEAVKRDSFPDVDLDISPSSFANQQELESAQRTLPKVLQVTASGLSGVAEAGQTFFDGIAKVLQQTQIAWANFENAANLTRIVQESLANRTSDRIFSSPFSLSINTTMHSHAPLKGERVSAAASNDTYWLELIDHNGQATYNPNPSSYQVFRNVKDFGAKGDGVTDDTAAINQAISQGSRCGRGCGSSTVSPAVVYFPPGTYLVPSPVISYYYTQLVGSPINRPTLLASPSFQGIAVIDEDPYDSTGQNWYINRLHQRLTALLFYRTF